MTSAQPEGLLTDRPTLPVQSAEERREGFGESEELFEAPRLEDGAAIWRLARDSEVLDLNSSYSYLLWCRDFANTSLVARRPDDGAVLGFVTGYVRPERPRALVVWQVAVGAAHQGRGLAGRMLDLLVDRTSAGTLPEAPDVLETTITADNSASIALFTAFARRRGSEGGRLHGEVLFHDGLFPDGHEAELLYRIPLAQQAA
jgi:L-2,4-diaminobutyric acid acetyltransferase